VPADILPLAIAVTWLAFRKFTASPDRKILHYP
jgi:hypothetical protein